MNKVGALLGGPPFYSFSRAEMNKSGVPASCHPMFIHFRPRKWPQDGQPYQPIQARNE